MKADKPGAYTGHLKYGLPASEQHRIGERHVAVMQKRKLLEDLRFAHALRVGRAPRAHMRAVRALQRRVASLEKASKPRPSPFVISFVRSRLLRIPFCRDT